MELTILAMAVGTYLLRWSFLGLGRRTLPKWLTSALPYVPAAVLSALVAPMLLEPQPPRWLGGLATGLVAWRTGSAGAAIAAGMAVFWIARIWL
ncbi:MAG: AzlD domain-containing protein [Candidatus Eremiobacteraeota bacterium]|nr:AzlD domain-containing protein [Candidatus Eremiobacteraeota bacterium]